MRKLYFLSLLLLVLFASFPVHAQFVIQKNENELGISGLITTYYNYNALKPGETDHKKNTLNLRDAQLCMEGKYKKKYEFKLQVDFANLAANSTDPETPGFMDAYMIYRGLRFMDIKLGYQKLPFSRGSLVSFAYSPFYHRAEIARGNYFSQRDLGLTLRKDIVDEKVRIFAGIYSGMGEEVLITPNDRSGKLEYLGRIEFNSEAGMKYRDLDLEHSDKLQYSIGAGARYAEKAAYAGNDYMIKTVNGKKQTLGLDFFAMYKGFSFTWETDQVTIAPNTPERLMNLGSSYFRSGGWYSQLNYYFIKLNAALSARYELSNWNDLVKGYTRMYTLGYSLLLKKYDSVIKLNYTRLLEEEIVPNVDPKTWNWQMQLGWQFMFN